MRPSESIRQQAAKRPTFSIEVRAGYAAVSSKGTVSNRRKNKANEDLL